MSYDVTIFGGSSDGERGPQLDKVAAAFHLVVGLPISSAKDAEEQRVFGLAMHLESRATYLVDTPNQHFSRFCWQLGIATKHPAGIVHPASIYLSRELARRLGDETMLCFNGVELHAATFGQGGKLLIDNISAALAAVGDYHWAYR